MPQGDTAMVIYAAATSEYHYIQDSNDAGYRDYAGNGAVGLVLVAIIAICIYVSSNKKKD